jgi:hypothetical protein
MVFQFQRPMPNLQLPTLEVGSWDLGVEVVTIGFR